ncbi:MAG: class I SAM-dependent methyltransferase [Solirubrobacterales bacterium]
MIPKHGVGVELGVQYGDFSAELMELADPERLHLVDVWFLAGKEWLWEDSRDRSTINALKGILERFEDELVSRRVVLHIGTDLEVLAGFPDDYLDWVYIDTAHVYEHVTMLLELLKAKVKRTGIVAGDDWRPDPENPHHGVTKAVLAFVEREPGYELIYSSATDGQWAIASVDRHGQDADRAVNRRALR